MELETLCGHGERDCLGGLYPNSSDQQDCLRSAPGAFRQRAEGSQRQSAKKQLHFTTRPPPPPQTKKIEKDLNFRSPDMHDALTGPPGPEQRSHPTPPSLDVADCSQIPAHVAVVPELLWKGSGLKALGLRVKAKIRRGLGIGCQNRHTQNHFSDGSVSGWFARTRHSSSPSPSPPPPQPPPPPPYTPPPRPPPPTPFRPLPRPTGPPLPPPTATTQYW